VLIKDFHSLAGRLCVGLIDEGHGVRERSPLHQKSRVACGQLASLCLPHS
jgi:hypothetical protein